MKLIEFIKSHPALKSSKIESLAGMPSRTIHNALQGTQSLPKKWIYPLCQVLENYGLEIDGWVITCDPEALIFLGEKKIPGREAIPIEIVPGQFEYTQSIYKAIWDMSDFIIFLNETEDESNQETEL